MKLELVLFALVLLLGGLVVAALLVPEAPGNHGVPHPDYPSLLRGAPEPLHDETILRLGWALGTIQVLIFAALMALGARRKGSLHGLGRPLILVTAVYLAVWTAIVLTYRGYVREADPTLYLALPAPTALMLYVLWGVPLVFVAFYVLGFRRWVLTKEDQAAFVQLVARRQLIRKNQES